MVMASIMHICSGLVGPKSENVEKVLVFKAILKGSEMGRGRMEPSKGRVLGSFRGRVGAPFRK